MYSQGLIGSDSSTDETPEFLAAFQARIDAKKRSSRMIRCPPDIAVR